MLKSAPKPSGNLHEELRELGGILAEFFSVVTCCLVIGSGIGLLQGLCAFSGYSADWQFKASAWSAIFGGKASAFLGTILYYWLFRGRIAFKQFCHIVFVAFSAGIVAAYIIRGRMGESAWVLVLVTPIAAIMASLVVWARLQKQASPKV